MYPLTEAIALEKSRFISSVILDFHMIDYLSIAVHPFASCRLTSFSVDVILLVRYVNCSEIFRGLTVKKEMTTVKEKYIHNK